MRCGECKSEMTKGTTEVKRHVAGQVFVEMAAADVCTCGEFYVSSAEVAHVEHRIAHRLVANGHTDPGAVRFMLAMAGVHINEILTRFPTLDREVVKGWRRGEGDDPPSEVILWAYEIARLGYIPDCRCGECLGRASTHPAA